jgi:hypothetical protein
MGLEPAEYLNKHTIFPYAVAFMPLASRNKLRDRLLGDASVGQSTGSLTKVVTHGVANRRFCPSCVTNDLKNYGEAYWHRKHHLPGVETCAIHLRPLVTTVTALRGNVLASKASLPPLSPEYRYSAHDCEILRRVAQLSGLALVGPPVANTYPDYRTAAFNLGFKLTKANLATAAFARELVHFFGRAYLAQAGCEVRGRAACHWPALMLRKNAGLQFATPKHILIQTFLSFSQNVEIEKLRSEKLPGPSLPNFSAVDQHTVSKLCDIAIDLELAGGRATVEDLIRHAGVWQSFRHHRNKYPLTKQFLKEFKQSDLSARQVGGRPYWRMRIPSRYGPIDDGVKHGVG